MASRPGITESGGGSMYEDEWELSFPRSAFLATYCYVLFYFLCRQPMRAQEHLRLHVIWWMAKPPRSALVPSEKSGILAAGSPSLLEATFSTKSLNMAISKGLARLVEMP
jgi:hypothetical protein